MTQFFLIVMWIHKSQGRPAGRCCKKKFYEAQGHKVRQGHKRSDSKQDKQTPAEGFESHQGHLF